MEWERNERSDTERGSGDSSPWGRNGGFGRGGAFTVARGGFGRMRSVRGVRSILSSSSTISVNRRVGKRAAERSFGLLGSESVGCE